MSPRADQLMDEALALEWAERSVLALALLESLGQDADADVASAWAVEIRQRKEELRSGTVTAIPWSVARARLLAL